MNRKQIRYLLARIRTEVEDVTPAPDDMPKGFAKSFESQSEFRGWMGFGVTWDVSVSDPWKAVLRDKSIEDEWNETLEKVVPELPLKKKTKKRAKKLSIMKGG